MWNVPPSVNPQIRYEPSAPVRAVRTKPPPPSARIWTPGFPDSPESRTPLPFASANLMPETQKVGWQLLLSSTRNARMREAFGRNPWKQTTSTQLESTRSGCPPKLDAGVTQTRYAASASPASEKGASWTELDPQAVVGPWGCAGGRS